MELICPSCEARYQVPNGSIGEKGRQVSCMSCGHGWHAFPPLVLGTANQAAPTTRRWENINSESDADAQAPRIHASEAGQVEADPPGAVEAAGAKPVDNGSRSEQLAEIREMLAEVQSENAVSDARQPGASMQPPEPQAVPRASSKLRNETRALFDDPTPSARAVTEEVHHDPQPEQQQDDAESGDPLLKRMEINGEKPAPTKPTDVRRLRRRHERRERERVRIKKAGSGAFLTGFLLVVMIVAVMAALYLLHPQIIQRMPATETAMTEYVDTIDGLRVSVAETYESVRGWVIESTDSSS